MPSRPLPEVSKVYDADLVSVSDADTLTVRLNQKWHKELGVEQRVKVRLAEIDAPELSTPEGKEAKQYVLQWLPAPSYATWLLRVQILTLDKWGRWLAYVWRRSDAECLNDNLLDTGHASHYALFKQLKETQA